MLILILQYCAFIWLNVLLIPARFHCRYLLFITLPFWVTPSWVAFPRKRKVLSIQCPASISPVLIAKNNCNISVPRAESNFYCFIYLQKIAKNTSLTPASCQLSYVVHWGHIPPPCVPSSFVTLKLAVKFTLTLIDVGLEPSSYRPDPDWAETAQPRDCWREQWLILHFNFWDLTFCN